MGFTSKTFGIIILEIMIALGILFFGDWGFLLKIFIESSLVLLIVVVVLIDVGLIIHKRIKEFDKKMDRFGERQDDLEVQLKRARDLVEVKAESRYLRNKLIRIEERMKDVCR